MYRLPKLLYSFEDLEPYIDTHTVGVHYKKHHQNYLNELNELLIFNNFDYRYSLNDLIYHIDEFDSKIKEDLLFNLGGVLNHNLYWKSIGEKTNPTGLLENEINNVFGSFDNLFNELKTSALKIKGSGYVFLIIDRLGNLDIVNKSNQDTPLLDGSIPLLNIDMWEHAYYLNYEYDKSKYLDNIKEIMNFEYASEIYNNIMSNKRT